MLALAISLELGVEALDLGGKSQPEPPSDRFEHVHMNALIAPRVNWIIYVVVC
jgi:hypothetical protein